MRTLLLATVALIGLSAGAYAQNSASPKSNAASNITAGTTHSTVAPQLPGAGGDYSPNQYIARARMALQKGRTGEAQEYLERAETRLLDRSTAPSQASVADSGPRVEEIRSALQKLAAGDRAGADTAMMSAIRHRSSASAAPGAMPMPAGTMPMPAGAMPMPMPMPAGSAANGTVVPANPGTAASTTGSVVPGTQSTMMQATSVTPAQPGQVTGTMPALSPMAHGAQPPGTQSTMMQRTSPKPAGVGASTTSSGVNMAIGGDDDPAMDPAFSNDSHSMNPGILPAMTPGTPTNTTPVNGNNGG